MLRAEVRSRFVLALRPERFHVRELLVRMHRGIEQLPRTNVPRARRYAQGHGAVRSFSVLQGRACQRALLGQVMKCTQRILKLLERPHSRVMPLAVLLPGVDVLEELDRVSELLAANPQLMAL